MRSVARIVDSGLAAFLWSLRYEQYDDLDGAAERVLFADDRPIVDRPDGVDRARDTSPANIPDAETRPDDPPP